MQLKGKVAVVTGAGRGIGKRLAIALAAEGARVGLVSRTAALLNVTGMEIANAGGGSISAPADVADLGQLTGAIETVRKAFGPIDILVNAAGVQGPIGPTAGADARAFDEVVRINLLGVFHGCRAVLAEMIARRSGKIINVSGGGASNARPFFSGYAASKAAVVRFTESLAAEVAEHNVQVNALAPGATYTHMTDQVLEAGERAGEKAMEEAQHTRVTGGVAPDKQIGLALFLVSPRSNHVTGKLISVHDDWQRLERASLTADHFTLRRISKP